MESLSPYRDCTTEVSIELFMLRLVDGALSSFSQLSCIMLSENLKAGYVQGASRLNIGRIFGKSYVNNAHVEVLDSLSLAQDKIVQELFTENTAVLLSNTGIWQEDLCHHVFEKDSTGLEECQVQVSVIWERCRHAKDAWIAQSNVEPTADQKGRQDGQLYGFVSDTQNWHVFDLFVGLH